jgi:RNA polymerase sigma-70 factor, ECF subfamily
MNKTTCREQKYAPNFGHLSYPEMNVSNSKQECRKKNLDSQNRYPGINSYAVQLIRFKARQLSKLPCFIAEETEDLEQELMISLLQNSAAFNPERASLNTFIGRVVESRASTLITTASARIRNSGQPAIPLQMVSEPDQPNGTETGVDALFHALGKNPDAMEIAIDFDRCVRQLSEEQKHLCQLLPFHQAEIISGIMGWSRSTFFRRVNDLRESFRERGLEYLFSSA